MKNFFCKQKFCDTCGVAFKPVTGIGDNLCSVHRAPVLEEARRRESALSWAKYNWEKVESMMKEERDKKVSENAAYWNSPAGQAAMDRMAQQQTAASMNSQMGSGQWVGGTVNPLTGF